jgi:condensin complex subunit 3
VRGRADVLYPDVLADVLFRGGAEDFWHPASLTPEKTFLARVYVEHCAARPAELADALEAALPVVTQWAFHIQSAYNALLAQIAADEAADDEDEDEDGADERRFEREEARMGRVCVVAEMLRIALALDYGDDHGRRQMFALVRACHSLTLLLAGLHG